MSKYNIYLCQPQQSTQFQGISTHWIPYSVGILWAYALQNQKIAENYICKDIFFKRSPINQVIKKMQDPRVVAFSCYVWNYEYNRKLASAIKNKWPDCLIVFGGPNVTKRPLEKGFFKDNPFVDTIVNGEGEAAFQSILLDVLENKKPKRVIAFSRLDDLNVPSPYSLGIFDKIIEENPNTAWQAVLETNRGCPHACTFCDWGSLTYAKVKKFSEDHVIADIDWMAKNKVEYVMIADANFGILYERDKKFAQYINMLQTTTGYPKMVLAQWTKNSKEQTIEIAKIFLNKHNRAITISVQSMDDTVLTAIKRKNMEISDLTAILKLCEKEGIPAYTDLILGLPYETKDTWKQNFASILEAGQHNAVDVWPAQLLENSELNSVEQLTLHEIEFINVDSLMYSSFDENENAIPEYQTFVKSTKYMPFDDLIDSYMFAHVVSNYHYHGWTQLLSRFLNKHSGIGYLEFYTKLDEHIKSGQAGIMSEVYFKIRTALVLLLSDRANEVDINIRRAQHGLIWVGLETLADHIDQIFDIIFKLFNKDFCRLDEEIYEELKVFQMNTIYRHGSTYPYQMTFNHSYIDYIHNDNTMAFNEPSTVEFNYAFNWKTIDDFKSGIYVWRRCGILHTKYHQIV